LNSSRRPGVLVLVFVLVSFSFSFISGLFAIVVGVATRPSISRAVSATGADEDADLDRVVANVPSISVSGVMVSGATDHPRQAPSARSRHQLNVALRLASRHRA
jgi:hypothetical protein